MIHDVTKRIRYTEIRVSKPASGAAGRAIKKELRCPIFRQRSILLFGCHYAEDHQYSESEVSLGVRITFRSALQCAKHHCDHSATLCIFGDC